MDVSAPIKRVMERLSTGQRWTIGLLLTSVFLWLIPGWLAVQVIESGYNTMEELVDRAFGMLILLAQVLLMLAACVIGFFAFRGWIIRIALVLLLTITTAGAYPVYHLLNSGRFPWEPAPPMMHSDP